MKTQSAKLGMAAATILVLFMMSAAAHAVTTTQASAATTETGTEAQETTDQCVATSTATSTETTETQQQTGDIGTSVQAQIGEDEPCGTNNQVGPNDQQGDNVNVVQADQGEQNQINQAESDNTIAGQVGVDEHGGVTSTSSPGFTLAPSEQPNGALQVQITGDHSSGPKDFIFTLSSAQDPTTHTLEVTLDGARVSQASSLGQILQPSSTDPAYIVVKSGSLYQLIVSVPHFSTHSLSIIPFAPGPSMGYFSISTIVLLGAIVGISVAFALAFVTRKRVYSVA